MPEFEPKPIYQEILDFSKQSTLLNLLESGVDVNFFDEILEKLNAGVTSGSNLDDLIDELQVYITGQSVPVEGLPTKKGVGALQRYVSQVSNDALTQFNATYNQTITQDLGIEWYKYSGTKIAKTRPFCVRFVNDYFHKKEVQELGIGQDPQTGKSLASEDLLAGRIAGTNASNIFINRGGWNCRHFFSPISARFVPKTVLKRNVNNGNFKPTPREEEFLK